MHIYFGGLDMESATDTDTMFASSDCSDHLFYYGVEFGSNPGGFEDLVIYDGIGRSLPVDIESVPALIRTLQQVLEASKNIDYLENLKEYISNEATTESVL